MGEHKENTSSTLSTTTRAEELLDVDIHQIPL